MTNLTPVHKKEFICSLCKAACNYFREQVFKLCIVQLIVEHKATLSVPTAAPFDLVAVFKPK